jgi:uncharacterized membrane protein
MLTSFQAPIFHSSQLFTMLVIAVIGAAVYMATSWDFSAKIVPLVIGCVALSAAGLSLFNDMCRKPEPGIGSIADQAILEVEQRMAEAGSGAAATATAEQQKIHMDLQSETDHLPISLIVQRAARFFGYLIVFMGIMSMIGLIPTVAVFVVFFMRYENRERWPLVITYAFVLVTAITFVFEHVMHIPWPPTYFGTWFPVLKIIPSLV